jgi:hypothetical protein
MVTGSANKAACAAAQDHRPIRFIKARSNHQHDSRQETPAPVILFPGFFAGRHSRRQPKQFRCNSRDRHGRGDHCHVTSQESSHESPAGTGAYQSVAAEAAAGMPAAEETKAVAEGSVGDS